MEKKSEDLSMKKEDLFSEVFILELILSLLLQEEFLVHTFGSTVPRKLKIMLTWTLLITLQSLNKSKCKLKMKPTESFYKATKSENILKTKKKQNNNSDLAYIKEVLFQEILLELSILKVLMLKHVVVLMLTILLKLVGLRW